MRKLNPQKLLAAILLPLTLMFSGLQAAVTDQDLIGMKLVKDTSNIKVYAKSGVDLSKYKSLYLDSVSANVEQEWLNKYNRDALSVNYRLNKRDLKVITGRYKTKFQQTVTEMLTNNDKLALAAKDKADLTVAAYIVNLKISAPDKTATNKATYLINKAGRAELHTVMRDAKTNEVVLMILDLKETRDRPSNFRANRVRNQYEFATVYKAWVNNWIDNLN